MIDLGNAHVIEWYLWQALHTGTHYGRLNDTGQYFPTEDWTRYDGELL